MDRQLQYAKKQAPSYKAGMDVFYKNSNLGTVQQARILDVHLDDELVPYYSIRLLDDGREKQTDDAHLRLSLHDDAPKGMEGAENDGVDGCSVATEEIEQCSVVTEDAPQEESSEKQKLVEKKEEVQISQGMTICCFDWLVQ